MTQPRSLRAGAGPRAALGLLLVLTGCRSAPPAPVDTGPSPREAALLAELREAERRRLARALERDAAVVEASAARTPEAVAAGRAPGAREGEHAARLDPWTSRARNRQMTALLPRATATQRAWSAGDVAAAAQDAPAAHFEARWHARPRARPSAREPQTAGQRALGGRHASPLLKTTAAAS
jgi:hypothetical protein